MIWTRNDAAAPVPLTRMDWRLPLATRPPVRSWERRERIPWTNWATADRRVAVTAALERAQLRCRLPERDARRSGEHHDWRFQTPAGSAPDFPRRSRQAVVPPVG